MSRKPSRDMDPVITQYVKDPNSFTLEFYLQHGGYEGLRKALATTPAQVIDTVKAAGLRGRGGAGFPTGMKWQFVPKDSPKPKYICCNADESEPGTFKDHVIMERYPHLLLEGCAIGCYAIGAKVAYIYIRGCGLRSRRLSASTVARQPSTMSKPSPMFRSSSTRVPSGSLRSGRRRT